MMRWKVRKYWSDERRAKALRRSVDKHRPCRRGGPVRQSGRELQKVETWRFWLRELQPDRYVGCILTTELRVAHHEEVVQQRLADRLAVGADESVSDLDL